MHPSRLKSRTWLPLLAAVALGLAACGEQKPPPPPAPKADAAADAAAAKEKAAVETAIDAYVYGYPLVTMEMTRRAVDERRGTRRAPVRRWASSPGCAPIRTPSFKDVTAPNADTLYTTGVARCVEGAVGPQHARPRRAATTCSRCSTAGPTCSRCRASARPAPARRNTPSPARAGRARCPPASPSTSRRPAWSGSSAASTAPARPRTTRPCMRCRTRCRSCRCQRYGKPYTPQPGKVDPAIDMKTAVRDAGRTRWTARVLQAARRAHEDQSAGRRRCADGGEARHDRLVPGQGLRRLQARSGRCQGHRRRAEARAGKDHGVVQGGHQGRRRELENGWLFTTKTGLYGTDYIQRALVTAIGLGANRPQDAVYPTSEADADGQAVQRREQVRHALRQGPAAAGRRASGR